jgi:hypothetical protein
MCKCGCNICGGAPVLNESKQYIAPISENMRYHLVNRIPIHENIFRPGSKSFIDLIHETRVLWNKQVIKLNEIDKKIFELTDIGYFGVYEGKIVPLDMPLLESEWPDEVPSRYGEYIFKLDKVMSDRAKYKVIDVETGKEEIGGRVYGTPDQLQNAADDLIKPQGGRQSTYLGEAEYQGQKVELNKPKRGGSKKFYVYVKNPKTKKIMKVSFGDTTGLKAKLNNPKARQAFAKRHDCANKKDRTKASYWSCNLPRYSKLLGFKTTFSGFW